MTTTIEKSCVECSATYKVFASRLLRGNGVYCSRKCQRDYQSPRKRFERNFVKSQKCWNWTGRISEFGYGQFFMEGKLEQAHRASYKIHKGSIPKGLCVCHTCDNRKCVNPKHLWIGTMNDNVQDMIKKGRMYERNGEKNPASKLSQIDVNTIRQLYKTGIYSHRSLANKFRVNKSTVGRIIRKQIWW